MTGALTERLPRLSLVLLSATALGYEILLTRLFAIVQWHHLAYMVISLALLGYGASGSLLTLTRKRLLPRFAAVYPLLITAFGVSAVACYLLAQQIPFHPDELLWAPHQAGRLLLIYLLLALPFFFAASAIALALARHAGSVSQLYAMDLLGSGLGSLAIIGLLFVAEPMSALRLLGTLALLAAAGAAWETGSRRVSLFLGPILLASILWALPNPWLQLAISPYKPLSQALNIHDTRVVAERNGPLGQLSVVQSPVIPWRHAPGLSLLATVEPLPQLALFTDADGMTALTADTPQPGALGYLDQLTSALPYHLQRPQRVLILGAGGGSEVLQARYHRVPQVDAVELNSQVIALVEEKFGAFTGRPFSAPGVRTHIAEARGFVADSSEHWDLIQVAMLDSFSASSAGMYALHESYLYTTEAISDYLDHLAADGQLAITRWVKLPPRDGLKLLATVVAAMKTKGMTDVADRLMMIRGWQTSTLLVKNGRFGSEEIERLQAFCRERGFDLAYYPGMRASEANHSNRLREPYFFDAAQALLHGDAAALLRNYKFDLTPASDERPYFFHFFKWSLLPELMQLRGLAGSNLLDAAYLVLVITLVQAVAASLVLILLPLWLSRRKRGTPLLARGRRIAVLTYFSAIGIGFLFLELAFIQRFIQFLHHPLYAIAVVLTGFLLFAGLGSAYSRRLASTRHQRLGVRMAVAGIALLTLVYIVLLGPLFGVLAGWAMPARIVLTILLIAPLAFCMGIPFPLALGVIGQQVPSLLPWAWAVNGCASVISAALATLLAIEFGFSVVLLAALGMYLIAALSFGALARGTV